MAAKETPAPSAELAESTITSLAVIDGATAALVYAPGALAGLVGKIKADVREQLAQLDVSIPNDRKRMISLADRVGSAKVQLDKMGESLIEEHRLVVNAVNADRKAMRDELAAFKVEVRKPVTDLENSEKERVAEHERALNIFSELVALPLGRTTSELIRQRIEQVQAAYARNWQEFSARAKQVHDTALVSLRGMLEAVEREEAEHAEMERLRAESAARAAQERDEAIAKAAREAAERKAEEQARVAREAAERERQRVENERAEAEARAKQAEAQRIAEADLAERLLAEAEDRRKQEAEYAQQKLIAAEQEAERQRTAAAEKAEREKEAAIETERKRVAENTRKAAEEAEKRAKNRAHLAAVNREILGALAKLGIPEDIGRDVVSAIAKGDIPHVTVAY